LLVITIIMTSDSAVADNMRDSTRISCYKHTQYINVPNVIETARRSVSFENFLKLILYGGW